MEQAKQNTQNLNIFTSHDLLIAMELKEYDEIMILDRKFRVRDYSSDEYCSEVKLYLLNSYEQETNISLSLASLIGIPFVKVN